MQSKPTIKIGFTDYYSPVDEYFTEVLSLRFNVERDDQNPDYLFFCDETFGQNNLTYDPNKTKLIFFTGENRRPWNYRCHHAISFDHLDGPHFFRLPLYVLDDWTIQKKCGLPSLFNFRFFLKGESPYQNVEKTGFCSFIVSNGGVPERNNIFHKLNAYKKVDSAGPLFNNMGYVLPKGWDGIKQKLDFMSTRKFNICYENGSYPGYVTEKLSQALYADTLPIYWGSPTVGIDFDTDCFISRHQFRDDEEMIEFIQYLDQDDLAYKSYRNEFTNMGRLTDTRKTPTTRECLNKAHNGSFLNWFEDHVWTKK